MGRWIPFIWKTALTAQALDDPAVLEQAGADPVPEPFAYAAREAPDRITGRASSSPALSARQ